MASRIPLKLVLLALLAFQSRVACAWQTVIRTGLTVDRESELVGEVLMAELFAPWKVGSVNLGVRSFVSTQEATDLRRDRLGTGPVAKVDLTRWSFSLCFQRFGQTAVVKRSDQSAEARGALVSLGWERVFQISENNVFLFGGMLQSGIGRTKTLTSQISENFGDRVSSNGFVQSILFGFRFSKF